MLGLGNVLKRRRLVACGVLIFSVSACGGKEFTEAAGGSGARGGSDAAGDGPGGSAQGGTAGNAGSAGSGGSVSGGNGGSGGTSACSCKAGQYCRNGSYDCFDCAELSRLRFAPPERLSTLSDNTGSSRSPRIGNTSTDLLYFFEGAGIRYTTDASTSAGGVVQMTLPQDSAPLLLDSTGITLGTLMGANFILDREVSEGRRQVYVGRWGEGDLKEAPAPFNGPTNDFNMAVATHPGGLPVPRGFWMTDRNMQTELVTATADGTTAAPLLLKLGSEKCVIGENVAKGENLTPWVTPDGKTMLVSHTSINAECVDANLGKDLYTAPLLPTTGQPTLPASLISDVNSEKDDVDPSFSADMCDLYFASNRDGENFALYRAHRQ